MRKALEMAAIIKWRQPKEAEDKHWCKEARDRRRSLMTWLAFYPVLGLGCLYAVYRLYPPDLPRVTKLVAVLFFVVPLWFYAILRLARKQCYEITEKGFRRTGNSNSVLDEWRYIEALSIAADPELPGLRILEFKVKMFKKPRRWHFDPAAVDEKALIALLDERLPGKRRGEGEISRPPSY